MQASIYGRLGKDAEARQTKAGLPMTVLQVMVDAKDTDAPTWCTVLAFEELAAVVAGLKKGTELYAKGRLSAALYTPQGGEPRVSLTLLASHVEPMVLQRQRPAPRKPAVVYGEDFDDRL